MNGKEKGKYHGKNGKYYFQISPLIIESDY